MVPGAPSVGCAQPRLATPLPLRYEDRAAELEQFAARAGTPLMPWQRWVARQWTAHRDGLWLWLRVLLECSRQQGKSEIALVRILCGLMEWGERRAAVATQNMQTTLELLERAEVMARAAGDEDVHLHRARGSEHLVLGNGAVMHGRAATDKAGRGLTAVDVLWLDEVRDVKEASYAALAPTTRAVLNPLIIMTSNAGHRGSELLQRMRKQGLASLSWDGEGEPPETAFASWSAPEHASIQPRAPLDQWPWEAIAQASPALGHTLSHRRLVADLRSEPDSIRETEILCRWVDVMEPPWPVDAWSACASSELKESTERYQGTARWLAVDVSPTRRTAALVLGQRWEDGSIAVRLLSTWSAAVGVVDYVTIAGDTAAAARRWGVGEILYDRWTASAVAAQLQAAGFQVTECSGATFSQASDELADAITAKRLVHGDQEELNAQISACVRKDSSTGGWRIVGSSGIDVPAACATAMVAHRGAEPMQLPLVAFV